MSCGFYQRMKIFHPPPHLAKGEWWECLKLLIVILLITATCIGCAKQLQKPVETAPKPAPKPGLKTSPAAPSKGTTVAPAKGTPSAPAKIAPGQPATPQMIYYTHTVRWPGETVSIIAGWYTGDIENWKVLAEANPDINPSLISEGLKIVIPENMMKTHDPMPKEFVDSFYPKPKPSKEPSKSVTPPTEEEEPVLFGPKKFQKK